MDLGETARARRRRHRVGGSPQCSSSFGPKQPGGIAAGCCESGGGAGCSGGGGTNISANLNMPILAKARPFQRIAIALIFGFGVAWMSITVMLLGKVGVDSVDGLDQTRIFAPGSGPGYYTYTDAQLGKIRVAPIATGGSDGTSRFRARRVPPRTVFYSTPSMRPFSPAAPPYIQDPMLYAALGEEAAEQDHQRRPASEGDCVPMKDWQTFSFPNCNAFHELDMGANGSNRTVDLNASARLGSGRVRGSVGGAPTSKDDYVAFLGRGWFRGAWRVDFGLEGREPVVLKTLRLEREFYDEYYDLHNKDALAMERLTKSPYVLNIYGYCGQSAINELADFFPGFTNLKAFARQMGGKNDDEMLRVKLRICVMMALGIAHMHEIDGINNATMVHYDINPMNVAIMKGAKPKLNDFNTVEFLRWNVKTNERCGFRGRLHEPWWRAPEELVMPRSYSSGKNLPYEAAGLVESQEDQPLLDEKIDVWALGNLIHYVLTGRTSRGQTIASRYAEVRQDVLLGKLPTNGMTAFYSNSTNPAVAAMRRAARRCFVKDAEERWSALDIAYEMMDTLDELVEGKEVENIVA